MHTCVHTLECRRRYTNLGGVVQSPGLLRVTVLAQQGLPDVFLTWGGKHLGVFVCGQTESRVQRKVYPSQAVNDAILKW